MPVCVLFVSSRSGIVFNPSAGAITKHSQTAKDIDQYFKSQLYLDDVSSVGMCLSREKMTTAEFLKPIL